MTRVCLVGDAAVNLQYELLSRETSRDALSTYDLERPFENSLAVRTVSVGAAVSLLNDLQWYIVRFVEEAIVQEPSVSETEWLSRDLATALRNGDIEPEETDTFCKIYGLEPVGEDDTTEGGEGQDHSTDSTPDPADEASSTDDPGTDEDTSATAPDDQSTEERTELPSKSKGTASNRLAEPLYARRTNGELPTYDLRDVDETLVVRVTEDEFSP